MSILNNYATKTLKLHLLFDSARIRMFKAEILSDPDILNIVNLVRINLSSQLCILIREC